MNKNEEPVIVEQALKASPEIVWKSITELEEMVKWYFDNIPEFKAEVGFKTQFNIESGERNFLHQWEITEVIPNKKIVYSWQYKDYPGLAYVSFDLINQNDKTLLKLTNTVIETFPDEVPEFRRESCIGGWEYFIKKRLKDYLEKSF